MNDTVAVEAGEALARSSGTRHLWLILAVVGAVLGAVGGFAGDALRGTFEIPPEITKEFNEAEGTNPPLELVEKMTKADFKAQQSNAALIFGILGAIAAAGLGALSTTLRPGSGNPAVRGGLGAVLGLLLGGAGGYAATLIDQGIHIANMDELIRTFLIHSVSWTLVGVAVGATCNGVRGALSGLAAGAIGMAIAIVLAMVLFANDTSAVPVPEGTAHFVCWSVLIVAFIGLAVGRSLPTTGQFNNDAE